MRFITGYLNSTGKSVFDPNVCTKSAVGFRLDENVANALLVLFYFNLTATQLTLFTLSRAPQLEGMHNKAHTGLLVLHPISTALIHLPQHTASFK